MRRLLALGISAAVVLLIGLVAQFVLPGLAADHVRNEIGSRGRDVRVKVTALPAVELLFHHADTVDISMSSYAASTRKVETLLEQAKDTGALHGSVGVFRDGLLTVKDATLSKRGDELVGTARVTDAQLEAAAGGLIQDVSPVSSGGGQLVLRGTFAGLVSADATVEASQGRLVLVPDVLFGNLATVTLLNDPHLDITAVSAERSTGGFVIGMAAKLR